MSEKVKLKGHESFSIREGWITKGLIEVKNNGKLFRMYRNHGRIYRKLWRRRNNEEIR